MWQHRSPSGFPTRRAWPTSPPLPPPTWSPTRWHGHSASARSRRAPCVTASATGRASCTVCCWSTTASTWSPRPLSFSDLLAAGGQLRVLATSREVLGVPGEVSYEVQPLPVPIPRASSRAATAGGYDAVRLFVDRAVDASPGFALTDANASAVAALCQRLDGLPLAIELAASRVRSFPPAELVERLDQHFELLSRGARTVLPRHRTLRAAIDWSYDLLGDEERALFDRLGVFPADLDYDAVEAVCTTSASYGGAVVRLLPALVDKSLVSTTGGDTPRYRLLESLRAYAAERLAASGADPDLRQRHAAHYLAKPASSRLLTALSGLEGSQQEELGDALPASLCGVRGDGASGDGRLAQRDHVQPSGFQGLEVAAQWAVGGHEGHRQADTLDVLGAHGLVQVGVLDDERCGGGRCGEPSGRAQGVHDRQAQRAAGGQDATDLVDGAVEVVDVLQRHAGHDEVGGAGGQWQRGCVGLDGRGATGEGGLDERGRDVDAEHPVATALQFAAEAALAEADVDGEPACGWQQLEQRWLDGLPEPVMARPARPGQPVLGVCLPGVTQGHVGKGSWQWTALASVIG